VIQNIKNLQQVDDIKILYEQIKTDGVIIKEEDKERYLQEDKRDALLFSKNLVSILKEISSELRKIIDFYYFQKGEQKPLSKIFISGGGTIIKNLADFFADEFKVSVEIFDPLKNIEESKKVPQELRPLFAVAAGLASRKVG
jgi:type IV pilus assembly protein PilM